FALVANLLLFAQSGKGCAICGSRLRKCVRAFAMGDSIIPVEIGTSAVLEIGNKFAKLWMDTAAVVALVVVFHQDFPVGGNVVIDGMARSKLSKGIALDSLDGGSKLRSYVAVFL